MSNYTPGQPRTVPAIDGELKAIQSAIADKLDRNPAVSQANEMNAELDMNSNKIINLADGTDPNDAVNKSQLDTSIGEVTIASIAHIDEYINPPSGGGPIDVNTALTNAVNAAELVVFGGTDITLTADWTYPVSGVARNLNFQGSTINLDSYQVNLDNAPDGFIWENGTVDGNWKTATLTAKSAQQPTTVTVGSSAAFSIGDEITSSWSLNYLPNSIARSFLPGNVINTVQSKTATTITFTHQVTVASGFDVNAAETNILPSGTTLINARFDKTGIEYGGSGTIAFKNLVFKQMPNAYCISINDSTEEARCLMQGIDIQSCALDALNFRGDTLIMQDVKVRDVRDIAKQILVWSNQTKKGNLYADSLDWNPDNKDAFVFMNGAGEGVGYLPDRVFTNCKFDGGNSKTFSPLHTDSLSTQNFEGRINSLVNGIAGKATFINCEFKRFSRNLVGTTFVNTTAWTQEEVTFIDCFMDCDGVYFQRASADALMNVHPVSYDNCNLKGSSFKLGRGADRIHYKNCTIIQQSLVEGTYSITGGEQIETSATTTRVYYEGEKIIRTNVGLVYEATPGAGNSYTTTLGDLLTDTAKFTNIGRVFHVETSDTTTLAYERGDIIFQSSTVRFYECVAGAATQYQSSVSDLLTNTSLFENIETGIDRGHFENTKLIGEFDFEDETDVVFDNLVLPFRGSSNTLPVFNLNFQENMDNKIIIEDVDNTDSTAIDLSDYFLIGSAEPDVPNLVIKVKDSDAVIDYGQDESTAREFSYRLKSRRFDADTGTTAPLSMRGAFMVDPKEKSVVTETRGNLLHQITLTSEADINANASSGASSFVITNITGGSTPYPGDWLSINVVGSSTTYFYEITAVTGSDPYTCTISPTLDVNITTADNCFLVKHEPLYSTHQFFEIERTTGPDIYANTGAWTNTLVFDNEETNEIPYAVFDGTDTFTLPAGKYDFHVDLQAQTTVSGTGPTAVDCTLRLSSDISGWNDIQGCKASSAKGTTTDSENLFVRPTLSGSFTTAEQGDFTVELYTTASLSVTADSNNQSSVITFTKVG